MSVLVLMAQPLYKKLMGKICPNITIYYDSIVQLMNFLDSNEYQICFNVAYVSDNNIIFFHLMLLVIWFHRISTLVESVSGEDDVERRHGDGVAEDDPVRLEVLVEAM